MPDLFGSFDVSRGYSLYATNDDYKATISFNALSEPHIYLTYRDTGDSLDAELTKEQITHFLSLDCADDFIFYAYMLFNN
ncbi:MAG: hypothetical protein WBB40_03450 [Psychrobacter alimentarius]